MRQADNGQRIASEIHSVRWRTWKGKVPYLVTAPPQTTDKREPIPHGSALAVSGDGAGISYIHLTSRFEVRMSSQEYINYRLDHARRERVGLRKGQAY